MNKKIESFLEEIHSLPDEKLDKKALELNLEALLSSSPEIKADDAFKKTVKKRLNNIVEFKQGNKAVRKIAYLKILFPILACFVLVVGVFSMVDIKLFQGDTSNVVVLRQEPESNPHPPSGTSPLQEEENINEPPVEPAALSIKEQILARAAQQKAAEAEDIQVESSDIPESNNTDDNQEPEVSTQDDFDIAESGDEEIITDLPSENTDIDISSTQLIGTPAINDTPEADIKITADEDLPGFLEDLLDTSNESTIAEEAIVENTQVQEGEIAREIFIQSCTEFGGMIDDQPEVIICFKEDTPICNQLDYENGKCSFLE